MRLLTNQRKGRFMAGEKYIPYGFIYCIEHRESGLRYVGQTTKSIAYRWSKHCGSGKTCRVLANAIAKYGPQAFKVWEVDTAKSKEELDAKEVHYIALWKTSDRNYGYNIAPGGSNGKHAAETCERIAAALRGKPLTKEHREKLSASHIGNRHSDEARAKMSASRTGMKRPRTAEHAAKLGDARRGKPLGALSEEHKAKIAAAHKGKKKKPLSAEHKAKISAALLGMAKRPMSEETRERVARALSNREYSEATRLKMSASHKGIKQSAETREKRAASIKGMKRSEEPKAKISAANTGRKFSEEHRAKLSAAKQRYLERKRNLEI